MNNAAAYDKSTASHFIDSRIYRWMCARMHLPSARIRNAAFDNQTESHA